MISIVVPIYNAEEYLIKCISSIKNQTYSDWELILINDGSTDASLKMCHELAKGNNRIKVIDQSNSGPSVARNRGIVEATGTYITFVDADDWVSATYLEDLLKPFLNNANIQLSCGGYVEYSKLNPNGLLLHDLDNFLTMQIINAKQFYSKLLLGITGVMWGKLFKTAIIKDNKLLLEESLKLSEDLIFVCKYAARIDNIAVVTSKNYHYNRMNENSLSGYLSVSNLSDVNATTTMLLQFDNENVHFNLRADILNRYKKSIVSMTNNVALSTIGFSEKVKNLNYIFKSQLLCSQNGFASSFENKLYYYLFQQQCFSLFIFCALFFQSARNLKKKL